jgi:hypothetical protein
LVKVLGWVCTGVDGLVAESIADWMHGLLSRMCRVALAAAPHMRQSKTK